MGASWDETVAEGQSGTEILGQEIPSAAGRGIQEALGLVQLLANACCQPQPLRQKMMMPGSNECRKLQVSDQEHSLEQHLECRKMLCIEPVGTLALRQSEEAVASVVSAELGGYHLSQVLRFSARQFNGEKKSAEYMHLSQQKAEDIKDFNKTE